MQKQRESILAVSEREEVNRLAAMIDEGNDLSYREWKNKVKRKGSICIAEHLLRCGVRLPSEMEDFDE